MRRLGPSSFSARAGAALALLLALAAPCGAHASDDPFSFEHAGWMSFDRYKEKPAVWAAAHADAVPEQSADAAAPVIVPVPVLPPARPVALPLMPGVNKGFDVQVSSTEESSTAHADVEKDEMGLADKNWLAAGEAARQSEAAKKKSAGGATQSAGLDVRPSFLPDSRISPIEETHRHAKVPAPEAVKADAVIIPEAPKPTVDHADPSMCAAVSAYKKQQLRAIESDRATLAALQSAISELGLNKQLDFMVGAGGHLNLEAASTPAIDAPTASVTKKD